MSDFFSAVIENMALIMDENPWIRILLMVSVSMSLFILFFKMFLRMLDPLYDFDPSGSLLVFCRWIKDKFIDILAKFVPGETLYKWGLARLGKEYVECDTQDCGTCPFVSNCKSPASAGEK